MRREGKGREGILRTRIIEQHLKQYWAVHGEWIRGDQGDIGSPGSEPGPHCFSTDV